MSSPKLILLIGYRGSGKTSVGKLLANRLGWAWCDSDDKIELDAGVSIREIFEQHGEAHFRGLETDAIKTLIDDANDQGEVISLGGGAPIQPANPPLWQDRGVCVYLRGSAQTLHSRIASDQTSEERRPDLTDEGGLAEVEKMLSVRAKTYEDCADLIIDVDEKNTDQIADQIADHY